MVKFIHSAVVVHNSFLTLYKRCTHKLDYLMISLRILLSLLIVGVLTACGANQETNETGYSASAQVCLAEALYFEARGTDEIGRRAVGEVILNRVSNPQFPSTICGVVDQRYNGSCQFSYRCSGPLKITEPRELSKANDTTHTLLTNRGQDITNGALFFHASSLAPGWFGTLTRLGTFGGNIFYR